MYPCSCPPPVWGHVFAPSLEINRHTYCVCCLLGELLETGGGGVSFRGETQCQQKLSGAGGAQGRLRGPEDGGRRSVEDGGAVCREQLEAAHPAEPASGSWGPVKQPLSQLRTREGRCPPGPPGWPSSPFGLVPSPQLQPPPCPAAPSPALQFHCGHHSRYSQTPGPGEWASLFWDSPGCP